MIDLPMAAFDNVELRIRGPLTWLVALALGRSRPLAKPVLRLRLRRAQHDTLQSTYRPLSP